MVGLALGTVADVVLVARSGSWSGSRDAAIMLGRKGCRGTTIAGKDCVIIIVVVIICQDLEGVVV